MVQSGNPIVLMLDGQESTYNSKPPLVIWAQALFIKLIGPNELAIRLPSALSAFGICLIILVFSFKTLENINIGSISVLILASTPGFIRNHFTRTGDLDAMLVFWTTLYTCVALHYLIKRPDNYKPYFLLITAGVILSFYSKSVAGLLPLPGLLAVSVLNKSIYSILKLRFLYVCILIGFVFCFGFYVIREWVGPGYLEVTFQSEYIRFIKNIMPWQEQPFHHYFSNLYVKKFLIPYLFVLPIALWFGTNNIKTRFITNSLFLYCLIYLLIITIPANKLEWYDAPIYPFLSLILGIGIYHCVTFFYNSKSKYGLTWVAATSLFILTFIWSLGIVHSRTKNNNNVPFVMLEREGNYMRQLYKESKEINTYTVLMPVEHPAHLTHAKFYRTSFNSSGEYSIAINDSIHSIVIGTNYLFCQDSVKNYIISNYEFENISTNDIGCRVVKITSEKNHN